MLNSGSHSFAHLHLIEEFSNFLVYYSVIDESFTFSASKYLQMMRIILQFYNGESTVLKESRDVSSL